MVALLTRRRLPFSAVTWDEMQDIMLACNPAIEDLIMTSWHEAMRHITANFSLYQSQLKAKLNSAISKIHISSDLWTSPHRHGVLAVCARWVDREYQPKRALLSLPEVRHSHSGEHQSRLILATLVLYGITDQLGCHTGDNATSNDTCLQHLSIMLKRDHNVNWDPKRHRIRCILHIVNLFLQAFLFASSREALKAALEASKDVTGDELYEMRSLCPHDSNMDAWPCEASLGSLIIYAQLDNLGQARLYALRGFQPSLSSSSWMHISGAIEPALLLPVLKDFTSY